MDLERMASDFLMASKRCEMASLESLLSMGRLVGSVSNLIHAVQRERGASNLFLGTRGTSFGDQLAMLVGETDAALERLVGEWSVAVDEVAAGADRTRLFSRLGHAAHALAGLAELRGRVREVRMSSREGVDAYSELVRVLLAIVFEAADAAVDPRISRVLVALFNLMEGKEFAGQERATGAGAFANGGLDDATRNRILRTIAEQERCFEVFEGFSDEEVLGEWRRLMTGKEQVDLEKLRRIACAGGSDARMDAGFSKVWFECTTRRIDGMKLVEEKLADRLQALCEAKLNEARGGLPSEESAARGDAAGGGAFVLYCGVGDLAGRGEISPGTSGPRLGRSLLEMLQSQTQRLQKLNEELGMAKEALEDRKLVEKAKGLLMKHRNQSEQEAHKMLRDLSMKQGCRMAEVAARLVALEGVWES